MQLLYSLEIRDCDDAASLHAEMQNINITHIYIYEGCSKFLHVEECVISSKLLQASDPLSHFILRQLHLNIYILLEDVGPCSPSSASSDTTSPQFRPSFRGKAIFRQALAKLSPNFREKSPNSFYKMKHT